MVDIYGCSRPPKLCPFFLNGFGGKGTCSLPRLGGLSHTPPLSPTSVHRSLLRSQASLPSLRQVISNNNFIFFSCSKDYFLSLSLYFFFFNFSFAELMDDDPPLAQLVFSQPTEYLRFLDEAAVWAHVCMQFFLLV